MELTLEYIYNYVEKSVGYFVSDATQLIIKESIKAYSDKLDKHIGLIRNEVSRLVRNDSSADASTTEWLETLFTTNVTQLKNDLNTRITQLNETLKTERAYLTNNDKAMIRMQITSIADLYKQKLKVEDMPIGEDLTENDFDVIDVSSNGENVIKIIPKGNVFKVYGFYYTNNTNATPTPPLVDTRTYYPIVNAPLSKFDKEPDYDKEVRKPYYFIRTKAKIENIDFKGGKGFKKTNIDDNESIKLPDACYEQILAEICYLTALRYDRLSVAKGLETMFLDDKLKTVRYESFKNY